MQGPPSYHRLVDAIGAFLQRLWRAHSTPHQLALAIAVGVFIGCSPFFGIHSIIGVGIAHLLHLNKVAVFLGTQISLPPATPVIGYASVQVGHFLLTGKLQALSWRYFRELDVSDLFATIIWHWALGGLFVGACLSLPAYGIAYVLARRSRNHG